MIKPYLNIWKRLIFNNQFTNIFLFGHILIKLAIYFYLSFTFLGCSGETITPAKNINHKVTVISITSGDTFRLKRPVKIQYGNEIKYTRSVQYIGIKTPKRNEPFYQAAVELNKVLLRKKGRLEFDNKVISSDGKLLAYVFIDELFINGELIKRGYARADVKEPNTRYAELFKEFESEAKEKKLGIWSLENKASDIVQRTPYQEDYIFQNEYVASKKSKVFHYKQCPIIEAISESNRIYFNNYEEAIASGRTPCKICKPQDDQQ